LLLTTSACKNSAEVAEQSETRGPTTEVQQTPPPPPAKIDPTHETPEGSKIVKKETITVNGQAACAIDIRYKGSEPQPVTWNGEGCEKVSAMFVKTDILRRMEKFAELTEEQADDIARLPDDQIFYIESAFSASIYPQNAFGRVYTISVSD
jgi:hypothetical protein